MNIPHFKMMILKNVYKYEVGFFSYKVRIKLLDKTRLAYVSLRIKINKLNFLFLHKKINPISYDNDMGF